MSWWLAAKEWLDASPGNYIIVLAVIAVVGLVWKVCTDRRHEDD